MGRCFPDLRIKETIKREVLKFVRNEVEIDALQLKALADVIDGCVLEEMRERIDADQETLYGFPKVAPVPKILVAKAEAKDAATRRAMLGPEILHNEAGVPIIPHDVSKEPLKDFLRVKETLWQRHARNIRKLIAWFEDAPGGDFLVTIARLQGLLMDCELHPEDVPVKSIHSDKKELREASVEDVLGKK